MSSCLQISVRFLLDEFHGRGDGGEPEWPPSPLRLFQALANAAARLGMSTYAPALGFLEGQPPPLIVASKRTPIQPRFGFKTFVPDNVGDLVANSWSGGRDNDVANYRVAKEIRPTRLPEDSVVHYLWEIDHATPPQFIVEIQQLARAVSAFGWGVNMVVVNVASVSAGDLSQSPADLEKWLPSENGAISLRVPVSGTFDALEERHAAFIGRLQTASDGSQFFRPVPPLRSFQIVNYHREGDTKKPPYAVFVLRRLDDSGFVTFDLQRRRLHLAGMMRHVASCSDFVATMGWDKKQVDAFVLGHDKSEPDYSKPTADDPRLMLIPLPSIEWRGKERGHTAGVIRRVLVTVSGHLSRDEFNKITRTLEGRELIDEKTRQPVAFLRRQTNKDGAISDYLDSASVWTTVTPVVLPGHDDPRKLRQRLGKEAPPLSAAEKNQIILKLDARIDRLLRKAFINAGLPQPLVENADLQWRSTGFIPGADMASHYAVPDQCRRFRRLHVKIAWREKAVDGTLQPVKLPGPLCVGSGRFTGLGLFVSVQE